MTASDSQVVTEIIERVSLKEVVEEYVSLKRAGKEYRGLCPFHSETSPSFYVIEKKKFFYCFGCQTGGDVIKFLQLAAGLSRPEAIKRLARRAGIELRTDPGLQAQERAEERHRAELLHALQVAQSVFRANLDGPDGAAARALLEERGVEKAFAERFGLGFGGVGGALLKAFEARKVPLSIAEELGLIASARSPGDKFYERFAFRLTFPIYNLDGAVIGFSGRLIPSLWPGPGDAPKYLNSPETLVFQKGDSLFGLYQARPAIRKDRTAVLVEGNFDVLAAFACGIENAVAPLGTALTGHQVRTLKRFANRVVILFDADDAGRKAARRAVGLLVEAGLEGHVAALPPGEDPDSLRRSAGREALVSAVRQARPMISWFIESLLDLHGRTPHGMKAVVDEAGALFALEKDAFRYGLYCNELARLLGVDVAQVRRALRKPAELRQIGNEGVSCPSPERTLLELFLLDPRFIHEFLDRGDPSWVSNPSAREVLGFLMNQAMRGLNDEEVITAYVEASQGRGGLWSELLAVLATPQKYPEETRSETFTETLADLERVALMRQRGPMLAALEAAQAQGRHEDAAKLMQEISEVNRRITALQRRSLRHNSPGT